MKVYQSIMLLFSCQFIHTLALSCEVMSGKLKQIDAGSGSVVGVNDQNEAFVLNNNVFTKIETSLKHVSVGPGGQLGVNATDWIFKLLGGSFVQIGGPSNKLFCGAMKVYQSIMLLFSCQFIHTLALSCEVMSGKLKQIDAGSGSVVGVNDQNEAFVLNNNVFTKIETSLKHVSVGPGGQLGVNAADWIFKLLGGSFVQIGGLLKQVDAGGDQIIAGVTMNDDIFCLNMDANNNWPSSTIPWVLLNGKLKYYSCGPYSCWGVNNADQIYILKDVTSNACFGSGNFVNIGGLLSMIEVATDGSVFGVNKQGNLFQRTGISRSNPAGTDWISMVVCPNGHKHVSFDLGFLWVVCVDGSIHRCTL